MGPWGTGIFDDDVAADVHGIWEGNIEDGPQAATQAVLDEFVEAADDPDDKCLSKKVENLAAAERPSGKQI